MPKLTINEFAKQNGITVQAVYQKLKSSNIPLTAIKDDKSKQLTEEGIELLKNLFDKGRLNNDKEIVGYIEKIEALKNELNTEKLKSELLNKRIEELTADRDKWHDEAIEQRELTKEAQQAVTMQARALSAASIKALTAGEQQPQRKLSFIERITGKIKGNQEPGATAAGDQPGQTGSVS